MVPALPEQRARRPRNQLAYTAHPSGAIPPARQTRRTPLNHGSWTLPPLATVLLPAPILAGIVFFLKKQIHKIKSFS
jgi:hypothetical protein